MARLAADFAIGIAGLEKPTLRERAQAQKKRRQKENERKAQLKEYDTLFDRYTAATDEFSRLRDNAERYAPKSPQEPFCDLYAEAMHKLPYCEYLCDALQTELYEYKRRAAAQCRQ